MFQEEEIAAAHGMAVLQVMSIIEEIREHMAEAPIVQVLQTILTMLVHAEMVVQKVPQTLVTQIMVDITTLVLRERLVAQTTAGRMEAETLHREVLHHQIVGREVHLHQVHQAGAVVALLQAAVVHREVHQAAAVEAAVVAVAVGQDK